MVKNVVKSGENLVKVGKSGEKLEKGLKVMKSG